MSSDLIKMVLVLEYDGTGYCGFQFQENAKTVQDEIEKALLKLTGEMLRVISASRTDSGVHARGQVVSYWTAGRLAKDRIVNGLNYYLPQDIAVKAAYKVNSRFNVRKDAVSREYSYLILNRFGIFLELEPTVTSTVIFQNQNYFNEIAAQILLPDRRTRRFRFILPALSGPYRRRHPISALT